MVIQCERTLKMWETGQYEPHKLRLKAGQFSETQWGSQIKQYLVNIVTLSDSTWADILQHTDAYIGEAESSSSPSILSNDSSSETKGRSTSAIIEDKNGADTQLKITKGDRPDIRSLR